ncbi:MAG: esterase [Lachnospiraceae bacterium]|nr:esterase [Lachnospiraceae bacterium]
MKTVIYGESDPDICLVQMVDDHDMDSLSDEYNLIKAGCEALLQQEKNGAGMQQEKNNACIQHDKNNAGILHDGERGTARKAHKPLLVGVHVDDWFDDLSPWNAPPVFGDNAFGNGAARTLKLLTEQILPDIRHDFFSTQDVPLIVGGYSLAGLWALWASYQTDIFSGCVAASPSVWFPGWIDYVSAHQILTDRVYLSLGRQEPKTRNPLMRTVGECIEKQAALLDVDHILEWNEGNHFKEPDVRTARGFVWMVERLFN